ncbi:MAG: cob(I)yrinic acid a,c-diamide adenosyltransferase [Alistipes sp.]
MKIYTKTGDRGETSLVGGERVSKCDERVEAYGSVDELMAFTALLGDQMRADAQLVSHVVEINYIVSQLMSVAALLAVGKGGEAKVLPIKEEAIHRLEQAIDTMDGSVSSILKFTIPGGHATVSMCHVCRTVCRRAERAALRADCKQRVDPTTLVYLNRLSDYFYLLGRVLTKHYQAEEILWIP